MKKQSKSAKKHARNKSALIEPLSPRVLYSVDVFGLGGDTGLPEESELALLADFGTTDDSALNSRVEVVFVDTSVSNYTHIIDSLLQSSDQNIEYVVYALEGAQSVSQIDDALASHNNLDAIHFITHGSDANFHLGSTVINSDTLAQYSDNFSQWGDALTEAGDILFYGCNLAETQEGKELVSDIAHITGADVGASDNRTGHESFGADWKLEYAAGSIETDESKIATVLNDWESKLDVIQVTTLVDLVDAQDLS